jgi:DNA-binding transcriptional MerR regulator
MENSEKLYYSISEVAKILDENQSTLRFWEKEFGFPMPRTNKKGTRFYTEKDIEEIRTIQYLLRKQQLTISGAKEKLKSSKKDDTARNAKVVGKLEDIKQKLTTIQKYLTND